MGGLTVFYTGAGTGVLSLFLHILNTFISALSNTVPDAWIALLAFMGFIVGVLVMSYGISKIDFPHVSKYNCLFCKRKSYHV